MFVRTTHNSNQTVSTTPSGATVKRTARWAQEQGASLVEYALLVALIAVVCITAVAFVGTSSSDKVGDAGTAVQDGGDGGGTPTTEPDIKCPDGLVVGHDGPYYYCTLA